MVCVFVVAITMFLWLAVSLAWDLDWALRGFGR
jgi:hypothetical protein